MYRIRLIYVFSDSFIITVVSVDLLVLYNKQSH